VAKFFKKIAIFLLTSLLILSQISFAGTPTSDNVETVNTNKYDSGGYDAENSSLVNTLCTLIMVLNGRFARVMAAVAIFVLGIMFFMGKITWPILIAVPVAFGIIFGAKTVAIALLPRATQIYNARENSLETKTTSEIITQACPELL
jgi:type IV secretory pathway VirB2 component (pilin)